MNREQMVEKAAQAFPLAALETYDMTYQDMATVVLNAILPEVTTVAELEALPRFAVVVDSDGDAWTKTSPGVGHVWGAYGYDAETSEGLCVLSDGPMTVVWQP